MTVFLGLVIGLFVTMALIPALVRFSGNLQLLDHPNDRKVHSEPIPRIGGIAVFVGTILPLMLSVLSDQAVQFYIMGALLIVLFGALDDRFDINFKWKFLGQSVAVVVAMSYGVRIESLPFFGLGPLPDWVSLPLTFVFILGVTNAINLSDGLDGLAGGTSLISLGCIAALAYAAGGFPVALAAAALIGAILGFLRFNTHPAVIFLGDAGSQFLGFSLAVLSLTLVNDINSALNPLFPVLLMGLPLMDTLSVVVLRLKNRGSPFKADKNHFHHRLLGIGMRHYEAVSTAYFLQVVIIGLAFLTRYQSDALVILLFLGLFAGIFGGLSFLEKTGWRLHPELEGQARTIEGGASSSSFGLERRNQWLRRVSWLPNRSVQTVQYGISFFLIAGAVCTSAPDREIPMVAALTVVIMVAAHFLLHNWTGIFTRLGVYVLGIFVVFLLAPLTEANPALDWAVNAFFLLLTVILALAIRLTRRETFQITPQDLLMLLIVLAVPLLPLGGFFQYPIGSLVLRAAVVFYACEYILNRGDFSYRLLRLSAIGGLCVMAAKGILIL
ncbi:MAG: MraY family glycosyltransferase [Pseudomonadota bacterium]